MQAIGRAVYEIAERQFGVVSRAQLLDRGRSGSWIDRRIAARQLHPIFAGVYAMGRRDLPPRGWWMGGVLAAGEDAALTHRSLGALHDVLRWTGAVEVTTPRRLPRRRGLRPHRASIPPDELDVVDGIPVTTVPRMLLDLAGVLPLNRLEAAMNRAEMLQLGGDPSTRELIDRYPRRRGVARLRTVLDGLVPEMVVTCSELEVRFRRFVNHSRLPRPELNAPVEIGGSWYVIDALWRAERLAVELDGYESHGTRKAFRDDRARDRALLTAGIRTARVTWRDLDAPAELEAQLVAMLMTSRARQPRPAA